MISIKMLPKLSKLHILLSAPLFNALIRLLRFMHRHQVPLKLRFLVKSHFTGLALVFHTQMDQLNVPFEVVLGGKFRNTVSI